MIAYYLFDTQYRFRIVIRMSCNVVKFVLFVYDNLFNNLIGFIFSVFLFVYIFLIFIFYVLFQE